MSDYETKNRLDMIEARVTVLETNKVEIDYRLRQHNETLQIILVKIDDGYEAQQSNRHLLRNWVTPALFVLVLIVVLLLASQIAILYAM